MKEKRGAESQVVHRVRSALGLDGHRYRSVLEHRQGAATIELLLAAILVLAAGMVLIQRFETGRRTATAVATIESTLLQPRSNYEQSPQGRWIRYYYVADGSAYEGYTFRRWLNVDAYQPKVCFDPTNPRDHILVRGSIRCGIDDGP